MYECAPLQLYSPTTWMSVFATDSSAGWYIQQIQQAQQEQS